jgi:hypothetical protein
MRYQISHIVFAFAIVLKDSNMVISFLSPKGQNSFSRPTVARMLVETV